MGSDAGSPLTFNQSSLKGLRREVYRTGTKELLPRIVRGYDSAMTGRDGSDPVKLERARSVRGDAERADRFCRDRSCAVVGGQYRWGLSVSRS
ncbi:hypothetical protein QE152_g19289 [Popillia japonica]|uniref:Uncharacterized protein n=1 Tax=Popillia japonica TaxID=7064 RepID=A0AAW1KRG7_POPJA